MKTMHKTGSLERLPLPVLALVAGTAAQAACSSVSVKGEGLTKEIAK